MPHRHFRHLAVTALAILLGGSLSACFPTPDHTPLAAISEVTTITKQTREVAVADLAQPSAAERALIADQLAATEGLRVQVRLPAGASFEQAVPRLRALGIPGGLVSNGPQAPGDTTLLAFDRFQVSQPDCQPLLRRSEMISADERPAFAFGCATYGNFVNMLADPADLAAPRSYGGANADQTSGAVQRYHDNKVEKLRRTTTATFQ